MKLSITQHEETFTIETPTEGIGLDNVIEYIDQLLRGAGYNFDGELQLVEDEADDKEERGSAEG